MRLFKNCECTPPKDTWSPSQEQIDATAPGGHKGYFPGKGCTKKEPCLNTTSYNDLKNKPSINSVELVGDKSCREIKVQCRMRPITNELIENMFKTYS